MSVFFRRFQLSRDIGIDLGTANTLIYVSGRGIVLQEPSVVALDLERGATLAVGDEAKLMLGRTPGNIRAVRPLRDGVIADFDAAEQMLKTFITKGNEGRGIMAPRLVVGIPSGVTGVERRAVREAGMAGAREVHLIDEPVAAAIGAGLPVTEPVGTMIVDIGGGTTEVAVLSLGGTVLSESVRVAGDEISDAIGIDLGTANTLIYVSGRGIVLQEPSVVALDLERGATLAVGDEAKLMLGRTPGNIRAVRPLRDGVIADFDAAEQMLKTFITKGNEGRGIMAPRLVVGIPSGVTGVERRAVREAGMAGAREVHLIDEPVAAAIGAGLPVTEPVGTMIVDIGGGTTEVAVLSLGGTVLSESVRVAGDEISDAIGVYLKKVHNMVVGERTAEDIKIRIGSAFPDDDFDQQSMDVRGLHLLSGLPRTINLKAGDLREAIAEPLNVIVEAVKRTLERTPPELAADIVDRGIMLAGGGALVRGISDLISHETGIFVHIAEDPLLCVVNGCGQVLEDWKRLQRVVDTPEFVRSAAGA